MPIILHRKSRTLAWLQLVTVAPACLFLGVMLLFTHHIGAGLFFAVGSVWFALDQRRYLRATAPGATAPDAASRPPAAPKR